MRDHVCEAVKVKMIELGATEAVAESWANRDSLVHQLVSATNRPDRVAQLLKDGSDYILETLRGLAEELPAEVVEPVLVQYIGAVERCAGEGKSPSEAAQFVHDHFVEFVERSQGNEHTSPPHVDAYLIATGRKKPEGEEEEGGEAKPVANPAEPAQPQAGEAADDQGPAAGREEDEE